MTRVSGTCPMPKKNNKICITGDTKEEEKEHYPGKYLKK